MRRPVLYAAALACAVPFVLPAHAAPSTSLETGLAAESFLTLHNGNTWSPAIDVSKPSSGNPVARWTILVNDNAGNRVDGTTGQQTLSASDLTATADGGTFRVTIGGTPVTGRWATTYNTVYNGDKVVLQEPSFAEGDGSGSGTDGWQLLYGNDADLKVSVGNLACDADSAGYGTIRVTSGTVGASTLPPGFNMTPAGADSLLADPATSTCAPFQGTSLG